MIVKQKVVEMIFFFVLLNSIQINITCYSHNLLNNAQLN